MDCGKRSVDRLPTNQDRSAGTSGRTASAVERGRNLGRPEFRLAGKLGATAQRKRYRCCRQQRENRVGGQAERAERAVSRVLRIGRFVVAGVSVVAGMPGFVAAPAVRCFVGAAVIVGNHRDLWSGGHRRHRDLQHPPQDVRPTLEQRRGERRRHRAEQQRGERDPGDRFPAAECHVGCVQTARIFSGCASVRRSRRALPRSIRASPASCPPSRTSA